MRTLLMVVLLSSAACRTAAAAPAQTSPTSSATGAPSDLQPTSKPDENLRGTARVHQAYCGGAAPTRELMERLSQPLANARFVVLKGDHNSASPPVASFVTGPDGAFELPRLPPGRYCVVPEGAQLTREREAELLALPTTTAPPKDPQQSWTDEACLKRLPLRCTSAWDTAQPGFRPRVDVTGATCPWSRPCVHYNGPLPP